MNNNIRRYISMEDVGSLFDVQDTSVICILSDPVLTTGSTFCSLIPSTAKAVVFTDEAAPASVEVVDLSNNSDSSVVGWMDDTTWKVSSQRDGIKVYSNENSSRMFNNKSNLVSIDLVHLDTRSATDMGFMFQGCSNLESLDLGKFDTSNVTKMNRMFNNCKKLTSLDVSNFDTSKVTTMRDLFYACSGLTSIDVSNFDTSNVTDMSGLFHSCSGLTSLDVSNFDTSNVTNMSDLFHSCSGLTSLDVSNFDTSNVTNMSDLFFGCSGLTSLDISNFDTSNVTNMRDLFYACSGLTSIDVSNFDTSNVTDMSGLFYYCRSLTSIDVSNFDTSNVTAMDDMFGKTNIKTIDVSHFDTRNLESTSWMFEHSAFESIDLSTWNTDKLRNASVMFVGTPVPTIDVSSFTGRSLTDTSDMFAGCHKLSEIDFSNLDTSNITDSDKMFSACGNVKTAYARSQKDADFLNNTTNKPATLTFVSVAPIVEITVDNQSSDLVTVNVPEGNLEGGFSEVTLSPVQDGKLIYSFDMNGTTMFNNTFVVPVEGGAITISNVKLLNIITESSDIQINMPDRLEVGVTEVLLTSLIDGKLVSSFKANDVSIAGDTLTITESTGHNIVISDIIFVDAAIIESEHPAPRGLTDVVSGEVTFEGAAQVKVVLESQIMAIPDYDMYYDWIYLYDDPNSTTPFNNKKYGGININNMEAITETIMIPGDYVKITFTTDADDPGMELYGFKATLIPVYI